MSTKLTEAAESALNGTAEGWTPREGRALGAVRFQREPQWCEDCAKITVHMRAVRAHDGWHSNWCCGCAQ